MGRRHGCKLAQWTGHKERVQRVGCKGGGGQRGRGIRRGLNINFGFRFGNVLLVEAVDVSSSKLNFGLIE